MIFQEKITMELVQAEILTIGDELLYGQVLDTNSHWMSQELARAGIKVVRKTTIGDVENEILTAFGDAEQRADIVLITGGLGPTNDDLTKPCLAKYFNCDLVIFEQALVEVTEFFKKRGRELTEVNRLQAALPSCCEMVSNPLGTAPGMWIHRNGKVFVSMPGVPHEMKKMMTDSIIPKLLKTFSTPVIHHQVIRTIGIGESFLATKIADWENSLPPHIKLAYLPGTGEVRLRLTGIGNNLASLKKDVEELTQQIKPVIAEYIYSMEDEPLEVAIGKMLLDRNISLAVAESCTGGYLAHLITSVPGSSAYFAGGMIPYSNNIKVNELGVSAETLKEFGAVSEATVTEMATLIRKKFNTDIGVATSGIAGPDGGTPDKPVGTVWIAYADKYTSLAKKLQLTTDRLVNIRFTAAAVLNLIRINCTRDTP